MAQCSCSVGTRRGSEKLDTVDRVSQWRETLHRHTWERNEDSRSPLIGFFWAGIWLFWLLSPLLDWLRMIDQPRGWIGAAAIVAFTALYLWHFAARWEVFGNSFVSGPVPPRRRSLAQYGGLLALAVVATVSIGQNGASTLAFFAISAMWTFAIPVAFLISIGVGVCYVWVSLQVPGWTFDSGTLIGLTFGTVGTFAGRLAGNRARLLDASRRENARLAVDEERNRMARDLHDILGHSLTVITVKAELAGKLIDVDSARAKCEIADLERLSRDALADVRRAVTGFREVTLSGELARA